MRAMLRHLLQRFSCADLVGAWRWSLAGIAAAVTLVTLVTFGLVLDAGRETVRQVARQRLVITEAVVRAAINRYHYLPAVLALDTEVRALLDDVESPSRIAAVNAKFRAISLTSNVSAVYLLDAAGVARSATNWDQPRSFVGRSYAYRPYFTEAVRTGHSFYFGVGTTTKLPGLFIGQAISGGKSGVAGVLVIKVDLERLQGEWRQAGEHVLVSDAAGVVFLASEAEWKYRPFLRLPEAVASTIREARQYGDSDLKPLLAGPRASRDGSLTLQAGKIMVSGLAETVAMPDFGWTLWYVAETGPVLRQALVAGLAAGISCLAVIFALAAGSQRRERLRSEQAMRLVLERRVAERTRDLSTANLRLHEEIEERERATVALRATQDELVHAGRLAALGQISTAINHEINQPLAALRTFLASSAVFLERGETTTVARNLQRMTEVTQRIAEIIRHLKAFARKTEPDHREAVPLRRAAEAVLDLLETRIRAEGIAVNCMIPVDAVVRAETVRLEQVLLNLMVNAMDAMREAPERQLDLTATRQPNSSWRLSVADSGSGIPEEHITRMFDPFFTTKAAGEGLGLGLSLSSLIVRDFGGSLSAENRECGAVLSIFLPAAKV